MRRAAAALAAVAGLLALAAPSVRAASTGDPLAPVQWGLDQVRAPQAWAAGATGAGAVVAVVDAGVDLDHPDLAGKLLPGATFFNCPRGQSPCGNGDWMDRDTGGASEHGTHVAGIIGAVRGNGIGVAGVAPDARIIPVKVGDGSGISEDDLAAGIRWAVDHGAQVINLSLGDLPGTQLLPAGASGAAIADAIARGVVVVAAAGNETFPLCENPAWNDGVLCVAATDSREVHSYFSNFGLKPDGLAISAPGGSTLPICGEDVVSTVAVGTGDQPCDGYGDSYAEMAGTSMATPHVAGVAALLAAKGLRGRAIVDRLLATARPPAALPIGYQPVYGAGIVDAAAAVR